VADSDDPVVLEARLMLRALNEEAAKFGASGRRLVVVVAPLG
jgi:hypothetical protein